MVTTFYPPFHFGGDATYVRALSRALVERGHEVEVVHSEDAYHVRGDGRPKVTAFEGDGITVHRLSSRFGLLSALAIQQTGSPVTKMSALREILSRDFDVVNFHNVSLVGGPGLLPLSQAPVTLYTLHEHWLLCPTHIFWKNRSRACDRPQCFRCSLRSGIPPQLWRYTGLIERSLKSVDRLLAPSQFTAARHAQFGNRVEIRVLPLFSAMEPGDVSEYVPEPRPRFVYAGRVTASKGVRELVETFSKLGDFDLQIVGEGDSLSALKKAYSRCNHVQFLGRVPQQELPGIFRSACALILPSLAPEAFGLIVAEALACGTPAIVSAAGGSKELIEATGGGFVYHDDDELVGHLQQLATDTRLRRELGAKARAGYLQRYTEEKHLEAYLGHIADIQRRKGMGGNRP